MRETRTIMGMPISLTVLDEGVRQQDLDAVFAEFAAVDAQFSPFKERQRDFPVQSRRDRRKREFTPRMREIIALCEKTKRETDGYFDIAARTGRSIPAAWSRAGRSRTRPGSSLTWAFPISASRPAATSNAMASMTKAKRMDGGHPQSLPA